jgi:hypothetical protein
MKPDWAQLVLSGIVAEAVQGIVEVAGDLVSGGHDAVSGPDLDGPVAAARAS